MRADLGCSFATSYDADLARSLEVQGRRWFYQERGFLTRPEAARGETWTVLWPSFYVTQPGQYLINAMSTGSNAAIRDARALRLEYPGIAVEIVDSKQWGHLERKYATRIRRSRGFAGWESGRSPPCGGHFDDDGPAHSKG